MTNRKEFQEKAKKLRAKATELIRGMLVELGFNPDTSAGMPHEDIALYKNLTLYCVHEMLWCNQLVIELAPADFFEASTVGRDGHTAHYAYATRTGTGRTFHLGQLVWIHDPDDEEHPIIKKGAILGLWNDDSHHFFEKDSKLYVHANTHVSIVLAPKPGYDIIWQVSPPLRCLEPIDETDKDKTAEEIQAGREVIKHRCIAAEGETMPALKG